MRRDCGRITPWFLRTKATARNARLAALLSTSMRSVLTKSGKLFKAASSNFPLSD